MRRLLPAVLLALSATACGTDAGSVSASGSTPPGSERIVDCGAEPLPIPAFDVRGVEVPDSGHLRLAGTVDSVVQTGGRIDISLDDATSGRVDLQIDLARPLQIDVESGADVEIDYWERPGFEGTARGIKISDDLGPVLIADDGDYGNAVGPEDLSPFTVAQTDGGCRNRPNRPGALNNFVLVVSSPDASVGLTHGETGNLTVDHREYTILAVRSVAGVGDVFWTDAPYEQVSFVITRLPA